ncbi:MAG: hypothetical protein HOK75_00020 [Phycisphaerae bacterium]|nr:hypothetical protein [Phycisphaerae bacterium]
MITATLISALCIATPAQLNERLPKDAIPAYAVDALDYALLDVEDENRVKAGLPMRFAISTNVSITPASHGIWERLENGQYRWTYRVTCENSMSMNLGFGRYSMPISGTMVIMNRDINCHIRPFTSADNKDHGELWTPIIPSNNATIEIVVDAVDKRALLRGIEITSINAGYRGFKNGEDRGGSGSCNIDVVCSQGNNWWDEIPSVGVYTLNGYLTCTGALINNTAQDGTPYFLTANHCGVTSSSDSSIVVYWNHQNSYCRAPGSGDSGGNGNGSFSQFTSGSTMRATRSYTDFTLTELSSTPNSSYEVSYSGWSRASSASVGAGIHHPSTAEKRISFPDYISASGEYWNVNWSEGTTEPGSSGSPLYDGNHRIVGQLCCGSAACGNDSNDYYGRSMYNSWTGSSGSSLGSWLDPLGTGQTTLDTYNPGALPIGACCIGTSGSCIQIREANCLAGGGTWMGADSDCTLCEPEPTCESDINGDGYTNVSDLLEIVSEWGNTGSSPADVNGDGYVGVADILAVIEGWGPC